VLWSVLGVLAVLALTFAAAIFVAAEFSLTTLERSQVDAHVAAKNDRRARAVQRAHRSLSFQLSGSQLGITVTTLVTGYIAEPAIATLFVPGLLVLGLAEAAAGGTATALALVLVTALSMVFGELVPKNLAIADPLRVAREADEGAERGRLVPELCRDRLGEPVRLQIVGEPFRPVVAAPDALALLVVGGALKDLRSRQPLRVLASARVVRVEVRQEDPPDVDLAQNRRPALLGVRQAQPGVDERPAVAAGKQVAVNVPDAERQRERQAPDPAGKLGHYAFSRTAT
jgi:hypothetical protein